jgi:6-phosphogluconolactonase
MIVADPTNKFVFVPCKGADYIAEFTFDAVMGKLTPNAVARVATATGAGPRHIAFHPNGKLAFVINETNSTMASYTLDANSGQLALIETKSTLPSGFTGANTGAEVWVHPSGAWLLGSNRGDDSIVVFSVDGGGHMTFKGTTKTGGTTPRDFTIDPTGAFVYVADQGSNDLRVFRFDAGAGTLTATGAPVSQPSPSFIGIVRLP